LIETVFVLQESEEIAWAHPLRVVMVSDGGSFAVLVILPEVVAVAAVHIASHQRYYSCGSSQKIHLIERGWDYFV
jgi:hypothetical protein